MLKVPIFNNIKYNTIEDKFPNFIILNKIKSIPVKILKKLDIRPNLKK